MQPPYLPAPDADFDLWTANFSSLITATPTDYGLVSGDATAIAAVVDPWHTAYIAATDPTTRTTPTIAAKDAARAAATAVVRPYAVTVSRDPSVSNELKSGLGVSLPTSGGTPIPAPSTSPALLLVAATPFVHQLQYRDSTTPTSKAKPAGAKALELWRAVGVAAAVDPSQCTFYQRWTKTPNRSEFSGPEVGKIATYFARWITASGPSGTAQAGPWSNPLAVTVI